MAKVIHLSTNDFGGAGGAACRIHESLLRAGVSSKLLVKWSRSSSKEVYAYKKITFINKVFRRLIAYKKTAISLLINERFLFFSLWERESEHKPLKEWVLSHASSDTSLIVVHWVGGFLSLKDVAGIVEYRKVKVMVMQMDMTHFTGGCHYAYSCQGYKKMCFACPATNASFLEKKVRSNFFNKSVAVLKMEAMAISSSPFVLNQAKDSAVPYKDYIEIQQPVNADVFRYRRSSKTKLDEFKTILIGGYNRGDERKGYSLFVIALALLSKKIEGKQLNIMVPEKFNIEEISFKNVKIIRYPFAKNDVDLAALYQVSDIFVNTSIDDSGPLMVIESLYAGTPIVATNTGCAPAYVKNEPRSGIVVEVLDPASLSEAIYELLYRREYSEPDYLAIESAAKDLGSRGVPYQNLLEIQ